MLADFKNIIRLNLILLTVLSLTDLHLASLIRYYIKNVIYFIKGLNF